MSKVSDISRLEFILEMIEDIEFTISENGSLTKALVLFQSVLGWNRYESL